MEFLLVFLEFKLIEREKYSEIISNIIKLINSLKRARRSPATVI